jgi:hypothetical protein
VRLRGKPCRNWRSLRSQRPPGKTTLRAEVQRVPYSSHNSARQPSPGAALFPEAPHSLRIMSRRAGAGGLLEGTRICCRRSRRHPRIQSSARTRQFRPSRWVCTSSSRRSTRCTKAKYTLYKCELHALQRRSTRCTKTRIPALSSTFAIACAIRRGVQENLRAILSLPFVG